jgi:hypothetical protein
MCCVLCIEFFVLSFVCCVLCIEWCVLCVHARLSTHSCVVRGSVWSCMVVARSRNGTYQGSTGGTRRITQGEHRENTKENKGGTQGEHGGEHRGNTEEHRGNTWRAQTKHRGTHDNRGRGAHMVVSGVRGSSTVRTHNKTIPASSTRHSRNTAVQGTSGT